MNSRIIAGKYTIEEEIARGGMGVIYRAEHIILKRKVAIKMLHPQFSQDPTFLQRFEQREARGMAQLAHDNIIQVFDVGQDEGSSYLVMEYFPGQDLKQKIVAEGNCTVQETVDISLQIARALAHAHGRGIVHRDIKPGNIMVDVEGRAKIADFGIAAAVDEAVLTITGQVMGTPGYMSPEQARGEAVDARSDLYSTGMVMYHMLAGTAPFEGFSAMAVMGKLLADEGELELDFPAGVPPRLEQIVRALVKRNPEERIPTAQSLAEMLQRLSQELAGGTVPTGGIEAASEKTVDLGSTRPPAQMPGADVGRRIRRPALLVWLSGAAVLGAAFVAYLYFYPGTIRPKANEELGIAEQLSEEMSTARQETDSVHAKEWAPESYKKASTQAAKGGEALGRGRDLITQEDYAGAIAALESAQALLGQGADGFRRAREEALQRLRAEAEERLRNAKLKSEQAYQAQRQADAVDARQRSPELYQRAVALAAKGTEVLHAREGLIEQQEYEQAFEVFDEATTLLGQAADGFRQARLATFEGVEAEAQKKLSIVEQKSELASSARKEADSVNAEQWAPESYKHAAAQAEKGGEALESGRSRIEQNDDAGAIIALEKAEPLLRQAADGFRQARLATFEGIRAEAHEKLSSARLMSDHASAARTKADGVNAGRWAPESYEEASTQAERGDEVLKRGGDLIEQKDYGGAIIALEEAHAVFGQAEGGFRRASEETLERLKGEADERLRSARQESQQAAQARQPADAVAANQRSPELYALAVTQAVKGAQALSTGEGLVEQQEYERAIAVLEEARALFRRAADGFVHARDEALRQLRAAAQEKLRIARQDSQQAAQARQQADAVGANQASPEVYARAETLAARGAEALRTGEGLIEPEEFEGAIEALAEAATLYGQAAEGFVAARKAAEKGAQERAQEALTVAEQSSAQAATARQEAAAVNATQWAPELYEEAAGLVEVGNEALERGQRLIARADYGGAIATLEEAQGLFLQAKGGLLRAREMALERLNAEVNEKLAAAERQSAQVMSAKQEADDVGAKRWAPELYREASGQFENGDQALARGRRYVKKQDYEAAMKALGDALSRLGQAAGYFQLAAAYGWFQKGSQSLLDGDRDGAQSCYDLALKRRDQALKLLRLGKKYDPAFVVKLRINRGIIFFQEREYEESLREFNEAIKLDPNGPNAYANRARTLRKIGDFDGAEKDYEKAIKLDPNNAETHNDYAWHLIDSGRNVDRGITSAERALELLPGSAAIMDTVGWGYFKKGEYSEAVYWLTEASRREPQNREFADHLERAQEALRARSN